MCVRVMSVSLNTVSFHYIRHYCGTAVFVVAPPTRTPKALAVSCVTCVEMCVCVRECVSDLSHTCLCRENSLLRCCVLSISACGPSGVGQQVRMLMSDCPRLSRDLELHWCCAIGRGSVAEAAGVCFFRLSLQKTAEQIATPSRHTPTGLPMASP